MIFSNAIFIALFLCCRYDRLVVSRTAKLSVKNSFVAFHSHDVKGLKGIRAKCPFIYTYNRIAS